MHWTVYLLYMATVGLIRVYKWLELKFLLLFTPFLKKKGKEILGSIGVTLHTPGDEYHNENLLKPERDSEECKALLAKTSGKYDTPIHIKVTNDKYFARLANAGSLAMGECFMDGTWDVYGGNVEAISELAKRVLENNIMDLYLNPWNRFLEWLELYAWNLQTRKRAFQVGLVHYNLGNDLYELMLDPWLQYTCGYWKNVDNLNDAQLQKMELIARKLELKPGMRVLDIGCGWGTLCKYLSEKYGVECVGVTISEEGVKYGKKICDGLPIDIRLQDYREVNEKFDRIVSVGMFEHVGYRNYRKYFEVAEKCLTEDGIFLLHTIGRNHYNYPLRSDPWSDKYIFPNGQVPSPIDISETTKNLFVIEDWHNFGLDYAKTLFCWRENFVKGWPKIQDKYGDAFYRMWICYLSLARGLFSSRRLHLWQIVLTKDGLKRDYRAVR